MKFLILTTILSICLGPANSSIVVVEDLSDTTGWQERCDSYFRHCMGYKKKWSRDGSQLLWKDESAMLAELSSIRPEAPGDPQPMMHFDAAPPPMDSSELQRLDFENPWF